MIYRLFFLASLVITSLQVHALSPKVNDDYKQGLMSEKQKDYVKAMEWYIKAAAQNNVLAQNKIGNFYNLGLGVQRNDAKAMEWYMKAATQPAYSIVPDAQVAIGDLYRNGLGVAKNKEKAKEWYLKAANLGNETARKNLKNLNHSSLK